jgi:hypothetical protein
VNAATLEQLLAAAGLSAGAASGLLGTPSNAASMKPAGTIKGGRGGGGFWPLKMAIKIGLIGLKFGH